MAARFAVKFFQQPRTDVFVSVGLFEQSLFRFFHASYTNTCQQEPLPSGLISLERREPLIQVLAVGEKGEDGCSSSRSYYLHVNLQRRAVSTSVIVSFMKQLLAVITVLRRVDQQYTLVVAQLLVGLMMQAFVYSQM